MTHDTSSPTTLDAHPREMHPQRWGAPAAATPLPEAARGREETRGSHWRDDFPERDDATWAGHFDAVMVDGSTELCFRPAPASDPAPTHQGGTS